MFTRRPPIQGLVFRERLSHGEDCLYLNVWLPCREGRRPVLVWLYGGGFEGGSASPPRSDGESLMHFGDVVVVACNYRLGGFGFLHLGMSDEPAWRGRERRVPRRGGRAGGGRKKT